MSKTKQSNWKDEYFDSIRSHSKIPKQKPKNQVRWGGTGSVEIIYYLADSRILDYVTFNWRIISDRPGLTPPTSFQNVSVLKILLPYLERAQSSNREVFVDFFTDDQGGSAEVITIATL